MKELPIDVDDIADIRDPKHNYFYSDKTELLYNLVTSPATPYFLSRPRRFGKTLLVGTLEAILRGRRDLFEASPTDSGKFALEALWIAGSDYDWTPKPVIDISLASASPNTAAELDSHLKYCVDKVAKFENIITEGDTSSTKFDSLINILYNKYKQKVSILIDEYDSPILNTIERPKVAKDVLNTLKSFYSVLKDNRKTRGFVFITGVTKFSKTSLFSGLNNLRDLTLDPEFSTICGLTLGDFDTILNESNIIEDLKSLTSDHDSVIIPTLDELREQILHRYDGYSWDGKTRVLNPLSVMSYFKSKSLDNFWFASGTPTFLIKLLQKHKVTFDCFKADNYINSEINNITLEYLIKKASKKKPWNPAILMFQTGYFSVIKSEFIGGKLKFYLGFPNQEVRESLVPLLLAFEDPIPDGQIGLLNLQAKAIVVSIDHQDPQGFELAFTSFVANCPYEISWPSESFFHLMLIFAFAFGNQPLSAEGSVGGGRYDIQLRTASNDDVIIEIKHDKPPKAAKKPPTPDKIQAELERLVQEAMEQMDSRKYTARFQGGGRRVIKMAVAVYNGKHVKAAFQEADNWALVDDGKGGFQVSAP